MTTCINEQSWVLTDMHARHGDYLPASQKAWVALIQGGTYTEGAPASVEMSFKWAMDREERLGDVCGWLHTHPGMAATPSARDYRTMGAWANCFGKPLLCAIAGVDGLWGYWFIDDETEPIRQRVYRARMFAEPEVDMFPGHRLPFKLLMGKVIKWPLVNSTTKKSSEAPATSRG